MVGPIKKVLKIIRSKKHPGAIFLKIAKTRDEFLCKVYPQETEGVTTAVANQIITAFHPGYQEEERKLPEISQEPIMNIDATPDDSYPLRILKAYRENCNCKWISDLDSPLVETMNKAADERAKLLDKAISILEISMQGRQSG